MPFIQLTSHHKAVGLRVKRIAMGNKFLGEKCEKRPKKHSLFICSTDIFSCCDHLHLGFRRPRDNQKVAFAFADNKGIADNWCYFYFFASFFKINKTYKRKCKMIDEITSALIYGLSAVLIMSGVVFQVKGTLDRAIDKRSTKSFWAWILKLSGFFILAIQIFKHKMDGFWIGMSVFCIASIGTILFYLLARQRPIR